jgi:TonB family protein
MAESLLNGAKIYRQWIVENLLINALFLSLLIHLLVFSMNMSIMNNETHSYKDDALKLKIISRSRSSNPKLIVNTEESKNHQTPKDSKFLGKKNQNFDRQTRSANIASFKHAGKGVSNGLNTKKYNKITSQVAEKQAESKKQVKMRSLSKSNHRIKMSDLSMNNPSKKRKQQKDHTPSLASLGLENGSYTTNGLSASSDFVEDLPLGDMTNLNTTEYKYFGFYDRIRKKLEQYWGNSLKSKAKSMMSRGVRLPAAENKITSLKITIDTYGNIIDVFVKSTSGISELDDAAIESFNKAGPFPNPPTGMVKNGHAEIEWGFVVKG